jgi:hypothetical protein
MVETASAERLFALRKAQAPKDKLQKSSNCQTQIQAATLHWDLPIEAFLELGICLLGFAPADNRYR